MLFSSHGQEWLVLSLQRAVVFSLEYSCMLFLVILLLFCVGLYSTLKLRQSSFLAGHLGPGEEKSLVLRAIYKARLPLWLRKKNHYVFTK